MTSSLYLGLISGTSADGIDTAVVSFADDTPQAPPTLLFGRTYPWGEALRARLVALGQGDAPLTLDDIGDLDARIGLAFADAAVAAIADSGIEPLRLAAIGSHGQTLRHRPRGRGDDGIAPFTLQLGDANVIAERTRRPVVADFRRRDVAAGGHGAPLVPALHAALLRDAAEARAVLNLGGIANVTLLPAASGDRDAGADADIDGDAGVQDGSDAAEGVRGFDTGPANGLMDAWCRQHTGKAFDRDGALAAAGRVDDALLVRLLDDPWFAQSPPKSTGRDQFHLGWLASRLAGTEAVVDVQATLLQLTARTIADALRGAQPVTARVVCCGGGVHNGALMAALAAALPAMRVESSAAHGIDPDSVEAMAFAWLARQTLLGRPGNLPAVSGARGPRVLGAVYAA